MWPDHAPDAPSTPEAAARYRVDRMRLEDVHEVAEVERRCFTNPWPSSAYRRELQHPDQNHYIVLRELARDEAADAPASNGDRAMPRRGLLPLGFGRKAHRPKRNPNPVVGFAGMWNAFDEAHVTTIAVDEPYRGRGLGEALLVAVIDEAVRRGATWMTLEVRVSNEQAQALYRKWGFSVQGVRKRYYSDNNEDAHIMWSRALSDTAYQAELAALRAALMRRIGGRLEGLDPLGPDLSLVKPASPPPWETGGA